MYSQYLMSVKINKKVKRTLKRGSVRSKDESVPSKIGSVHSKGVSVRSKGGKACAQKVICRKKFELFDFEYTCTEIFANIQPDVFLGSCD